MQFSNGASCMITWYIDVSRPRVSMPRPVDALPWGSRSTTSVRYPSSARQAPRFTDVVVLPTPPFWLATASTRGRADASAVMGGGASTAVGSDMWLPLARRRGACYRCGPHHAGIPRGDVPRGTLAGLDHT